MRRRVWVWAFDPIEELVAVLVGDLVLTVAHGRAQWHRHDLEGPWWQVPIARA